MVKRVGFGDDKNDGNSGKRANAADAGSAGNAQSRGLDWIWIGFQAAFFVSWMIAITIIMVSFTGAVVDEDGSASTFSLLWLGGAVVIWFVAARFIQRFF